MARDPLDLYEPEEDGSGCPGNRPWRTMNADPPRVLIAAGYLLAAIFVIIICVIGVIVLLLHLFR